MRTLDFLPAAYREAQRRRKSRVHCLWLGMIGLSVLAMWFGVDETRLHRTRGHLDYLLRQNQTVQAGLEQIARLRAEQATLLQRCKLIQDLQPPVSVVETLSQIARVLPEQVILRQLHMTCGRAGVRVAAESQAAAAGQLHVAFTGLAPSQIEIAMLVGQLCSCRQFANVRLEYSKAAEMDSHQVHEFRVTFDVSAQTAAPSAATGA